jgi:hypothetical protein
MRTRYHDINSGNRRLEFRQPDCFEQVVREPAAARGIKHEISRYGLAAALGILTAHADDRRSSPIAGRFKGGRRGGKLAK